MATRKKLIAGNWKMNGLARRRRWRWPASWRGGRGRQRAEALGCDLLVCPPATLLAAVRERIAGSGIALGGQDCHAAPKGAFTGDISAEMLADAGCTHVILGHSERRHGHGETDALVRAKIAAARRAGLDRDPLRRRDPASSARPGEAIAVVGGQLAGSIPDGVDRDAAGRRLRAGLGDRHRAQRRPSPTSPRCMRRSAPRLRAGATRILYGGSVNPTNAAAILRSGRCRRRAGRRRQPRRRRFLGDRRAAAG